MKYHIVYADPPWKFSSKQLQKYNGTRFHSLEEQYSLMTTEDIKCLPIIKNITHEDCALFLWTTDAHIPDALEVITAWGFRYVTVAFVWVKKTRARNQVATLGAWTMKNCELCLLGIKGKMLKYKQVNNVYQLVESTRIKHSKKPNEVRVRIEQLFGDLSRIELFARERFEGWDAWGNELENKIQLNLKKKFSP